MKRGDRQDIGCRHWDLATKFDPAACALADRHYSRRKVGSPQFMPPGQTVVLVLPDNLAVFGWWLWERIRATMPGRLPEEQEPPQPPRRRRPPRGPRPEDVAETIRLNDRDSDRERRAARARDDGRERR